MDEKFWITYVIIIAEKRSRIHKYKVSHVFNDLYQFLKAGKCILYICQICVIKSDG